MVSERFPPLAVAVSIRRISGNLYGDQCIPGVMRQHLAPCLGKLPALLSDCAPVRCVGTRRLGQRSTQAVLGASTATSRCAVWRDTEFPPLVAARGGREGEKLSFRTCRDGVCAAKWRHPRYWSSCLAAAFGCYECVGIWHVDGPDTHSAGWPFSIGCRVVRIVDDDFDYVLKSGLKRVTKRAND